MTQATLVPEAKRQSSKLSRRRVLLTDAEQRATLAACRSLARAGYEVMAVASRRPALCHWSRYCESRFTAPDPRESSEGFLATLETILRKQTYDILLPGTDASLLAISEHRERVEPYASHGLPPHEAVVRSLDKIELVKAASEAGLPCPRSVVATDAETAVDIVEDTFGYPVVLKPSRSFVLRDGRLHQRPGTVIRDAPTLVRALPGFGTPFILQEWDPNPRIVSFAGVVAGGRLLASATSRYRRTWPVVAGSASLSETIDPIPGLEERVEALTHALGWEGIFELELLDRNGELATLDLNPRLYGSIALAIRSGADLPVTWCDWLLGRDPPPVVACGRFRYRWEEGELRNVIWLARRGRLIEAASVLRLQRHVVHANFRLSDPAPAIAWAADVARRGIGRLRSRGLAARTPSLSLRLVASGARTRRAARAASRTSGRARR